MAGFIIRIKSADRLTQFKPSGVQLFLIPFHCSSSYVWDIHSSPGWHQHLLGPWVDIVRVDRTASGPINVQGWRYPWAGVITWGDITSTSDIYYRARSYSTYSGLINDLSTAVSKLLIQKVIFKLSSLTMYHYLISQWFPWTTGDSYGRLSLQQVHGVGGVRDVGGYESQCPEKRYVIKDVVCSVKGGEEWTLSERLNRDPAHH